MNAEELGNYLSNKRKEKGLSIYRLSKESNVSHSYISQLERGIKDQPSPEILKKLAGPLGIPPLELMFHAGHVTMEEVNKQFSNMVNLAGIKNGLENIKKRLIANGEFKEEIKHHLDLILLEKPLSGVNSDNFIEEADKFAKTLVEKIKDGHDAEEYYNQNKVLLQVLDELMKLAERPDYFLLDQLDDALKYFITLLMSGQVGERPWIGKIQEEFWEAIDTTIEEHSVEFKRKISMTSPDRVNQIVDAVVQVKNNAFKMDLLTELKRIAHKYHLWEDPNYELRSIQSPIQLEKILENDNLSFRGHPITDNDRELITAYLDALFKERISKEKEA